MAEQQATQPGTVCLSPGCYYWILMEYDEDGEPVKTIGRFESDPNGDYFSIVGDEQKWPVKSVKTFLRECQ